LYEAKAEWSASEKHYRVPDTAAIMANHDHHSRYIETGKNPSLPPLRASQPSFYNFFISTLFLASET